MWWLFGRKEGSGFSSSSTAEEVTDGIDGTGLTAIVTGSSHCTFVLLFFFLLTNSYLTIYIYIYIERERERESLNFLKIT